MRSGSWGLGGTCSAGLVGVEEQPAIQVMARSSTSSFLIATFLVRFLIASLPGLILNERSGRAMDFYLQQLKDQLARSIEGLTDQQLTCRPLGKWCAAEILEHLYLTYTGTIRGFERCLAAGKPLARPATIKDRLQCMVVIGWIFA